MDDDHDGNNIEKQVNFNSKLNSFYSGDSAFTETYSAAVLARQLTKAICGRNM
jgi:hypothetical protein